MFFGGKRDLLQAVINRIYELGEFTIFVHHLDKPAWKNAFQKCRLPDRNKKLPSVPRSPYHISPVIINPSYKCNYRRMIKMLYLVKSIFKSFSLKHLKNSLNNI